MSTPDTPTPSPETPALFRVPESTVARRFLTLAVSSLAVSSVWLAVRPEMLLEAKPGAPLLGWLYLLVVGFFSSAGFAAFYSVAPLAFHTRLFREVLAHGHFYAHVVSVLLLLPLLFGGGVWLSHFWPVLYALPLIFVLPLVCSLQSGKRGGAALAFLRAAGFWLVVTFAAAILLTANHFSPFVREGNWIAGTLQILLAGVFGNLILGTLLALVSPPSGDSIPLPGRAWMAFLLINLGVALLFHAMALGPRGLIVGCAAVFLAGVTLVALEVYCLQRRAAQPAMDPPMKFLFLAVLLIIPCALIGVAGLWGAELLPDSARAVQNSGVLAALLGVVALAGIGLLDLLRPCLETATSRSPLLSQIQVAGYINDLVGVSLMVPGIWIGSEKIVSLGTFFFVMGIVGFLAHAVLLRQRQEAPVPQGAAVGT